MGWMRTLGLARQAAGLALVAELGHLAMVLVVWSEWAVRGAFHTLAAIALGLLAANLWFGAGRRTLRRGVAITVILPVLWLGSRTIGIPSILTFTPLPVGVVDTVTTVVELCAAVVLVRELRRRSQRS